MANEITKIVANQIDTLDLTQDPTFISGLMASQSEVDAGVLSDKAISPATLESWSGRVFREDGGYNIYGGTNTAPLFAGGVYNILAGYNVAPQLTSGDHNIHIGKDSGGHNAAYQTGNRNVTIGSYSGQLLTTGGNNILIGHQAGDQISTGNSNIVIGYTAGPTTGTLSNQLFIDNTQTDTPLLHGNFDTETITVNGSFNFTTAINSITATEFNYLDNVKSNIQAQIDDPQVAMGEPTGITDRTESTISFDEGTRTFTISPAASPSSFEYWISGEKYTVTSSINHTIDDIEGMHYLYLDSSQTIQEISFFEPTTLLVNNAYVCAIYWDATNNVAVYLADERHGITMDAATHTHFHLSFGTQYISGFGLGNIVADGDGSSDTHSQFLVSGGSIRDEDLFFTFSDGDPQDLEPIAQIPIFYREGVGNIWRKRDADNFPLLYAGDGVGSPTGNYVRVPYNALSASPTGWELIAVTDKSYVLVHYLATNDIRHPVIAIQGLAEYGSLKDAQDAAATELNSVEGLPFEEFTPLATVIYNVNDAYTNTTKAAIQSTSDGGDYVDWRDVSSFAGGVGSSINDHGNLSGLGDDDHTQYYNQARGDARYKLLTSQESLNDISDINIPGSPSAPVAGDYLRFNGSPAIWEPATPLWVETAGDTMTGDLILSGSSQVFLNDGVVGDPSIAFSSATSTGIYYSAANGLNFSVAGNRRLSIEGNGTLNVSGTTNYENLVTSDDDIPNKKYVDDAIGAGGGATQLGQLTDVTITTPTTGDLLVYNGEGSPASWENNTIALENLSDVAFGSPGPVSGQQLTFNGVSWSAATGGGLFSEDANRNILGGTNAGYSLDVTAADNFVAGYKAFENSASATNNFRNIIIGNYAGQYINDTSVNNNVAIGHQAFGKTTGNITGGAGNVLLGYRAGRRVESNNNVAIGNNAMATAADLTGAFNIAIGNNAMTNCYGNPNSNIAIGNGTMLNVGSGSFYNVALGDGAGDNLGGSSNNNTLIGHRAGEQLTGGSDGNIALGHNAGPTSTTSNKLFIDNIETDTPLIGGDFSTNDVTINGRLDITAAGSPATPLLTFNGDPNTGIHNSTIDTIGFTTAGINRLTIESDGTLSVLTINYENLVTSDDDIPNKKYVDDVVASGSGLFVEDGNRNILGGTNAGTTLTGSPSTAYDNFVAGYKAFENQTTGDENVVIGNYAGQYVTASGLQNVLIGHEAGELSVGNTTMGTGNVAVGYQAGHQIHGSFCIAIGKRALRSSGTGITGSSNVAIGSYAMQNATSSVTANIAIGTSTLQGIGSNSLRNVAIGSSAGDSLTTTCQENVIVGYKGADKITSGSRNVIIGNRAGPTGSSASDKLFIDNEETDTPLIYGDFSTDELTINGTLDVAGVGSPPLAELLFNSDTGTKITSQSERINFATAGTTRFSVESDGTLSVLTTNYETLVIADDDIPNKKYVDDAVAGVAIGSPPIWVEIAGDTMTGDLTMSGSQILLDDGTESAPGLAFASATNTGIYYAFGALRITEGGAEVVQMYETPGVSTIRTENLASNQDTNDILILSSGTSGTGVSGDARLESGNATGSGGNAGAVRLVGGTATDGTAGSIILTPGLSTTGTSGTVDITQTASQIKQSAGDFAAVDDAVTNQYVLRTETTNATQTEMFRDGTAGSVRMRLSPDSTWRFEIHVVARKTLDGSPPVYESAGYKYSGVIDRTGASPTTTAIVGSVSETIDAEDSAAWSVTVDADNANNSLRIQVTGEASKTIRWVAFVRTVEVTG